MEFRTETNCRSCGGAELENVLDLGESPLADRLPTADRLDDDPSATLTLAFCPKCALVQIRETVPPETLFCNDYPYFSSVSPVLLAHFRDSAENIIADRGLGDDSFVIEAASNDGYMLQHFTRHGCRVLGIDPADGPVAAARERGIETLETFFSEDLANTLRSDNPRGADVFLANNVLAHVPDLNGFVRGIRTVLAGDGIAVIEAPYLVDLIDELEFDTIYHQHLCYFSVTALDALFKRHDLHLNRVERTSIHGGSLRLFVEPTARREDSVQTLLREESARHVDRVDFYRDFAERVSGLKSGLTELLTKLKRQNKTIAGYGAAAKATTMLAYCGIDGGMLDFIADRNEHKHGRYMGGNHIPIAPPAKVTESMPDYVLILAWNFADEIRRDLSEYENAGGRFIVPVPEPKIL
jgi:SAM-dependent methyltransferase